jgi:glycosyltransferase involved in cell wall biosynthesis
MRPAMVIVSNGFSKFHLSVAAAEADRRQTLSGFLTGAYPTPLIRKVLSFPYVRDNAKAKRLGARRDRITDRLVHPLFSAEALYALGLLCHSDGTVVDSFRLYGWSAIRHVEKAAAEGAKIYHYRAGFGGKSVEVAKRLGMFTLCDHASVHPSIAENLVKNRGSVHLKEESQEIGRFWNVLLDDIEKADAVLVNSHFAQETFRLAGHDRSPVHVIYLGVDDRFLEQVPPRKTMSGDFCLLFAGLFGKGKGAEALMDAFESLSELPCRLEIAGPLDAELLDRSRRFFSNPRVEYLGLLSREELAKAMSRADIFVFPSFSEGSARVVFEALACGCYVITTPNSGSIVEDGIHGSIVPPGDSSLLANAVRYAFDHRDLVSEIGCSNALLVNRKYTQREYGDQLAALYKELLG